MVVRLRDWCKARGVSLSEVMRRSGVAYTTVLAGADGKLSRVTIASKISEATDGEVTIAELCSAPEEAA